MREIARNVTIATSTYYRPDSDSDNIRAEIAKRTFRKAADLGYEVAVVDAGSSDGLLKEFERYGARLSLNLNGTMGSDRRKAIEIASNNGRRLVAWTEPEKEHYVPELWKTALPIIEEKADMVIPDRRPLDDYPIGQQYAENLGNLVWKELTGLDLDMWCGPRTFRKELSHYFVEYDGKYGDKWDSIFIPVMDAVSRGEKVIGVKIDYKHPKEQTKIEERDVSFHMKRINQLDSLTKAFVEHWNQNHTSP
ncbi:MAG: hypothetical protein AABX49_02445 [Nanoarchaeota archaeon]